MSVIKSLDFNTIIPDANVALHSLSPGLECWNVRT